MAGRVKLIFAGNRQQALEHMRQHGLSDRDARYIVSLEVMMGIENPDVVRVGTWYERPDREQIELQIRLMTRGLQSAEKSVS